MRCRIIKYDNDNHSYGNIEAVHTASIGGALIMFNQEIVKAWKDPAYRESLSDEQLASLPDHPAGFIELSDEDMLSASGGCTPCGGGTQKTLHTCWFTCRCWGASEVEEVSSFDIA